MDSHIQAQVSLTSHLPETPSCVSAEMLLISYGLVSCWEMCLCVIVSLIQMKGLVHLPLSLSWTFTVQTCHQCKSGESVVKQTCPLTLPCRWPVNQEVEIQGGTAWCVQAAGTGEIKDEVVPIHIHLQFLLGEEWERFLLLPKCTFDSMGIPSWQCQ